MDQPGDVGAGQNHGGGQRGQGGGHHRAAQRQPERGGAASSEVGHQIDQQCTGAGAGDGHPDVTRGLLHIEPGDADDDCQRGAGVDPEQAWIGQRIAGQALHGRPGHGQRGPCQQRQQGAGQTAGDRRFVDGVDTPIQQTHERGQIRRPGADDHRHHDAGGQRRQQQIDAGRARMAWPARRQRPCLHILPFLLICAYPSRPDAPFRVADA